MNEGIGGNHLLTNGLGQSALQRFDRDVLAVSGVKYVIVLEGINDLGGLGRRPDATQQHQDDLVKRMIGALEQIVLRAHAHGIFVYGCTIMPDGGGKYYAPSTMDNVGATSGECVDYCAGALRWRARSRQGHAGSGESAAVESGVRLGGSSASGAGGV